MNSLSIISSQVDRVIGSTPPSTPNKPDSSFSRGLLSRRDSNSSNTPPLPSSDAPSALPQNQSASPSSQSSPTTPTSATRKATTATTTNPFLSQGRLSEKTNFDNPPKSSQKPPDNSVDDELDNDADSDNYSIPRSSANNDGVFDPDEATAFLPDQGLTVTGNNHSIHGQIWTGIGAPFRWVWSALACSGSWIASCFYDENARFSPLTPLYGLTSLLVQSLYHLTAFDPTSPPFKGQPGHPLAMHDALLMEDEKYDGQFQAPPGFEPAPSPGSGLSRQNTLKSQMPYKDEQDGSTLSTGFPQDNNNQRRSVRIRVFNQESNPKSRNLKSPTSPSAALRFTRYPKSGGPPRPLLPKNTIRKTLILDLDETLIHSMSKGGRMSSGHMVEVKLDKQHAILYYVHKRPYCDEFLRKVCKWYNVVVFTASVQEYADPVIDWLDAEKKLFTARYYRQHCTYRDGVYVKDLSLVEPDLSKVMIVDNSPVSYIFHKDNAIPIEGWISDPSDLDLLHLIPLLQGLQFVTDVRAFLALRMGEAFG